MSLFSHFSFHGPASKPGSRNSSISSLKSPTASRKGSLALNRPISPTHDGQKQKQTIHLIRHAEAWHNVDQDHTIHDPELTPRGKAQCENLAASFPHFAALKSQAHVDSNLLSPNQGLRNHSVDSNSSTFSSSSNGSHRHRFSIFGSLSLPKNEAHNSTLIVASPMVRTVQTALIGLKPAIDDGIVPILTVPLFQETGDYRCDTGSDRAELEKFFAYEVAAGLVDFSPCKDGWADKTGLMSVQNVPRRAALALRWLKQRKEDTIVVVTHGGFLHYLTDDWSPEDENTMTSWRNTEYRTYHFATNDPVDVHLIETEESQIWRKLTLGNENEESKEAGASVTEQREVERVEQAIDREI